MRKYLILVAMLSVLLFGLGSAYAATSALENMPGGAGITYFECNNGWQTLINIQNTTSVSCGASALVVHVIILGADSNEVMNFDVPLSVADNWGASITCNGSTLTSTPDTPVYFSGGAYTGAETRSAPYSGNIGYVSATITGIDADPAVILTCTDSIGDGDGDPRNDTFTSVDAYLPDSIFMRSAVVNVSAGSAFALNSIMLQGFANIAAISEVLAVDFWDSIADAGCAGGLIDWNNDGDFLDAFTGNDDLQGLAIDTWEIYITDNLGATPTVVTDACVRGGRWRAVGSRTGIYWGRYNENPAIPTNTTLITIFPANSGTGHVGAASRAMTFSLYNDNEDAQSDSATPAEVDSLDFGTEIATNGTRGEALISVAAPMYGFTFTTAGNFSDLYPIVRDWVNYYWLNTQLFLAYTQTPDVAASEVFPLAGE